MALEVVTMVIMVELVIMVIITVIMVDTIQHQLVTTSIMTLIIWLLPTTNPLVLLRHSNILHQLLLQFRNISLQLLFHTIL